MAVSNLMLRLLFAAAALALVAAGLSGMLAGNPGPAGERALLTALASLLAAAALSFVLLVAGCGPGARTLLIGGSVFAYAVAACVAALLVTSATFVPRGQGGAWGVLAIFAFSGAIVVIGLAASDGVSRDLGDPVLYSLIALSNTVLAGGYAALMPVINAGALGAGAAITGCLAAATALPLLGSKLGRRRAAPGGA